MKETDISTSVRKSVYERDSWDGYPCCIYCGSPRYLHIHHVVERSRGGMGVEQNLVTLCNECHAKIHNGDRVIHRFCEEYLQARYPSWSEEGVKYTKW